MAKKARSADDEDKQEDHNEKRQCLDPSNLPITQRMMLINPRIPHPRDIDQPEAHHFDYKDLGAHREGENFDKFDVLGEVRRRGGAACNSVLIMKHNKPLPMWFDEYLCPRVMPGKWCGYVAYAFRRRILIGTWRTWFDVPDDVKEEAWNDILASWDFRTALTSDEHAELKKLWTTYASDRMRNWRTQVARRYIWKPKKGVGHPCAQYRWLDPKEWDLFEEYRRSEAFEVLRKIGEASAEFKQYEFHGGSGGYRKIILDKGKEKMQETENMKVNEGIPRERAQKEALSMNITIDRSVVFVEGNRVRKTGKIAQKFVRELEPKINQMLKDQEAGKLVFKGKEDILTKVTGKKDHPGRYRGCPSTAKLPQAMPVYHKAKERKRATYRRPQKRSIEEDGPDGDDIIKLDKPTIELYTEWVKEQVVSNSNVPTTLHEFFKHQKKKEAELSAAVTSSDPEGKDTISCFLNIEDSNGVVRRVSAGLVIDRPASVPPQHASQCVQVRPPIILPQARLPFYDTHYKTVGSAVGAYLNWPDCLIEYEDDNEQEEKEKVEKKVAADLVREGDESESEFESETETDEEEEDVQNSETDDEHKEDVQKASPPRTNVNWEFAHHVSDPSARNKFLDFLNEMERHPNSRCLYEFDVGPEVFGTIFHKIHIVINEAKSWIISCKSARKEWIPTWLMDMWCRLPEEDKGRVQLVSTGSSYCNHIDPKVGQTKFVEGMIKLMEEKTARLYVVPLCRKEHWRTILILPELSTFYCLDSMGPGITEASTPFEHEMLMRLGAQYDKEIRPSRNYSHQDLEWKIVNLQHKKQPFTWECGYYTMLYVERIVLLHAGVNVDQVFNPDSEPYPMTVIEGVVDSFCRYSLEYIADECRRQNDAKKKSAKLKKGTSSN